MNFNPYLRSFNQINGKDTEKVNNIIDCIKQYQISANTSTNTDQLSQDLIDQFHDVEYFIENTEVDKYIISEFLIDKGFHIALVDLIKYFNGICDTFKPTHVDDDDGDDENIADKKCIFETVINLLNYLLFYYPVDFKLNIFKHGVHKYLLYILNDQIFLNNFCQQNAIKTILMNIWLLGIDTDFYKNEWLELDAANILTKIGRRYKQFDIDAYGSFAMIATDDQINTLPDIEHIITVFVDLLKKAVDLFNKNEQVIRENIQLNEENESPGQYYDIYGVSANDAIYLLTNILNVLYKFSINNKIKIDLFSKHGVGDLVKIIIFKGSEIEKKYALKLLAQLCFDSSVLDIVSNDCELIKKIKFLSENCSLKSICEICKQILWSIDRRNKNQEELSVDVDDNNKKLNNGTQVMISYNTGSREVCLKIKNKLEQNGYKIWIDINEICGSSLDSMSNAIETSQFIIMCVTEKYRQSINCQLEVQYAFKLKKPIIPLILQKGYDKVNGWLGMLMSDIIYINFVKYSFDDAMERLLKQLVLMNLKLYGNEAIMNVKVENQELTTRNVEKNSILNWSEEEVINWFKSKSCMRIYEKTRPINGGLLYELYEIQLKAPEFFYELTSLTKSADDIQNMLLFSSSLKNLFK